MDVVLGLGVALLAITVSALVIMRALRGRSATGPRQAPITLGAAGTVTVVLEVEVERADRGGPAVQRLVHDAAARVFAMMPGAEEVDVRSPGGALLGTATRTPPRGRRIAIPERLFEPHARRPSGPDLAGHLAEDEPFTPPPIEASITPGGPVAPPLVVSPAPPRVADRFDLPDRVRELVRDPDDPVDLIRAILEAAGVEARMIDDDGISVGDQVIIVAEPVTGLVGPQALNRAFIRFRESGAARGLVVALGLLDPHDVRRREILAPHVLHVGPEGIQRMADAVAVGADPLRFAAGPALAPRAP